MSKKTCSFFAFLLLISFPSDAKAELVGFRFEGQSTFNFSGFADSSMNGFVTETGFTLEFIIDDTTAESSPSFFNGGLFLGGEARLSIPSEGVNDLLSINMTALTQRPISGQEFALVSPSNIYNPGFRTRWAGGGVIQDLEQINALIEPVPAPSFADGGGASFEFADGTIFINGLNTSSVTVGNFNPGASAVPEPSVFSLAFLVCCSLGCARRRRRD